MRLFMVVYHKKDEKTLKECDFWRTEYFRTERKAKKTAMLELAGNTVYSAATVYHLNTAMCYIRKEAEFGIMPTLTTDGRNNDL